MTSPMEQSMFQQGLAVPHDRGNDGGGSIGQILHSLSGIHFEGRIAAGLIGKVDQVLNVGLITDYYPQ